MQSLCISFYQTLVPGISNVTLRMRYYGFYAWLCSSYAHHERHTGDANWKHYLRRAEALLALVTMRANMSEAGISGVNWARGLLRQELDVMVFSAATDQAKDEPQYLQQDFGAFSAAYGSQLRAVGLLQRAKEHKTLVPTKLGESLANVFANAIGDAGPLFLEISARGVVTSAELYRLASLALGTISNTKEREAYEALLIHRAPDDVGLADSRRLTLELVLRMAAQFGMQIGVDTVRWAAYAQRAPNGEPLKLPTQELETHCFAWAVYHANDLLHAAYECLFLRCLQHLASTPAGLRPQTLVQEVSAGILEEWKVAPATWQDLLDFVQLTDDAWSVDEHSEYQLSRIILGLRSVAADCGSDLARVAVTLLATLAKRLKPVAQDYLDVLTLRYGPTVRHELVYSLYSEFNFFQELAQAPLGDMLQKLLHRILERHTWIAFQKLRYRTEYTFLFESHDGLLRTRGLDGPVLTNPRLASTLGFMRDLNLLDQDGITTVGAAALERMR
ncbi:hypothetical protein [Variovorax paradoxus]|uniref:hypothetical protein n=1 Tax=Variovorax paradoxus TaxID=34073 RepID=UPI003391F4D7